jgi:6-pyruvoyltetrahydropterin/6-carboxytetrahydropterin synthase
MRITRRLEFDAGHRIPNHAGQCRYLHGHRYALEVTLSGDLIESSSDSRHGMVMDFAELKALAWRELVAKWDHAFLAWREDHVVLDFLATIPEHRTVILALPPTAEHLAQTAFHLLGIAYDDRFGTDLKLERVRLYETPNCWADALRT